MNSWVGITEWLGCWTGVGGAALLALHFEYSSFGWILFIISNIAWIAYAYMQGIGGLRVQHVAFMGTSILGIYRWIII